MITVAHYIYFVETKVVCPKERLLSHHYRLDCDYAKIFFFFLSQYALTNLKCISHTQ